MVDKSEAIQCLSEIAALLELKGENVFKVRAYQNAARILENTALTLPEFVNQAKQGEIKGIGAAISSKLEALCSSGELSYLKELRSEFPPGVIELMSIPGVGPKKAGLLAKALGIKSVEELEQACRDSRVAELKGFGEKTQAKIIAGIASRKQYSSKFLYPEAWHTGQEIAASLKESGHVGQVEVAGSIRRRKEVVADIDIVATSKDPEGLMQVFVTLPRVKQVLGHGDTKSTVVLYSGIQVDLRVVEDAEFPAALLYFTGSKAHNTKLRGIAQDKKLKLNEYGLFKGKRALKAHSEEELYHHLGLAYVPPELREDQGEIEFAAKNRKGGFPKLVELADIRGVLHAHSSYSDGKNTLEEMAKGTKELGYEYLGITEHSKSSSYAGGLTVERIRDQHQEIEALNKKLAPFKIFKGIECDILVDGALDYTDEILKSFDFVIVSVHSRFGLDKEAMTARILRAISNPYTTILGHLTGRLLLEREGYAVEVSKILECAAKNRVAVEINCNPRRLELDWRYHRQAVELGVKLAICPDAHSIRGLSDIEYGIGVARKGGLEATNIINCGDVNEIQNYFRMKR